MANFRLYVDPATIFSKDPADVIPNVYPFMPVYRRNRELEKLFPFGIYDAGINRLAKEGDYGSWWGILPDIPAGWEQVIPDYPYDVLRNCPKNIRTPERCIRDSDFLIEKYYGFPKMMPSLQYEFGDARSLYHRLADFRWNYPKCFRFGIGNTCKLRSKKKQLDIGKILCNNIDPVTSIHIFGCPTELLKFLITHAKFPFSVDSNKFPWGEKQCSECYGSGELWDSGTNVDYKCTKCKGTGMIRHMASGKVERRRYLLNYMKKVGLNQPAGAST